MRQYSIASPVQNVNREQVYVEQGASSDTRKEIFEHEASNDRSEKIIDGLSSEEIFGEEPESPANATSCSCNQKLLEKQDELLEMMKKTAAKQLAALAAMSSRLEIDESDQLDLFPIKSQSALEELETNLADKNFKARVVSISIIYIDQNNA